MQDVQIMVRVVNRASSQLQAVAKDAERMGHSFKASQIAFQYLQFQAFAGLMAIQVGLVASAKAGFDFNKQMELMEMRWTNITGSATEGQAMVEMMRQIVKETSLTTEQISNFANRLLQAGIPIDQLESKLMGLANIQAKYGLSNEEAQRFVLGFTQALSKGKLQAEEMNQMLEAGVPIYQILQEEFGWTREELQGLGRDSEKTGQALEFLGGEFLEGRQYISDYAKTTEGVMNRLKDAWVAFSGALQEDVFQTIKQYMDSFSGYLERVTEDIRGGSSAMDAILGNMSENIRTRLQQVVLAFQILFAYNIGTKLATMAVQFGALATKVGGLKAIFAGINPTFIALSVAMGVVVIAIMKLIEWYNQLNGKFPVLTETMGWAIDMFKDMANVIMTSVSLAFEAFGVSVDTDREKVRVLLDVIILSMQVFGGLVVAVGVVIDALTILFHTIKMVVDVIQLVIGMMDALAMVMTGDVVGGVQKAKQSWTEYKDSVNDSVTSISSIIQGEGMGSKLYAELKQGLDNANMAISDFESKTYGSMSSVKDSVTGAGEMSEVGFGKIRQGASTAGTKVRTETTTMGTKMLEAGRKANEAGNQVKSGMGKAGSGAQEGANKVKQASKTVGEGVLEMGRQAQAHAPKVSQAVGKAGADSQREASKLPPALNRIGVQASGQYGQGIASNKGAVSGGTRTATSAGEAVARALNWAKYGVAVISTFAGGIGSASGLVRDAVSSILQKARSLLPSSDAKTGPLSDLTYSGGALATTFANGIYKKSGDAVKATSYMAQQARNSLNTELGTQMFGQQQYLTVYHVHQGQVDVVGDGTPQQANQYVGDSIGYEGGLGGLRTVIRQNGGSRF